VSEAESLRERAASGDLEALEEAWLDMLNDPGPSAGFLQALDAVTAEPKKQVQVALSLLPILLETYAEKERYEDAFAVARRLATLQPLSWKLRRVLLHVMRELFAGEPWLEVFMHSCRIDAEVPMDKALELFDRFEPYKPGCPVEHRSGWGCGVVDGYYDEEVEVRIRFQDGQIRGLPLTSAMESLMPIDPGDLKAMYLINLEGLRELAQTDPGLLVRKAVTLWRGKATAAKVKEVLVDKAVPASGWAKWWPKAKKAAAHDPYLKVEGGSRPVFFLRDEAVSMEDAALADAQAAPDLNAAVECVRSIILSGPAEELLEALLADIAERLRQGVEEDEDAAAGTLLDAALLIEEFHHKAPYSSIELFQLIDVDDDGHPGEGVVEVLDEIPSDRGRRLGFHALMKAFPEEWAGVVAENFHMLPRELMTPAVDVLVKGGHEELLQECWHRIEKEPWRYPWPVFHLSRKVVNGDFGNGSPSIHEVVIVMLRCLESPLFHSWNDRYFIREINKRYEELLFEHKRHILEHFLHKGERVDLERAYKMVHVTTQLPKAIADRLAVDIPLRYPDLKVAEERYFWEDGIYCSRKGINKRSKELKELIEVKIPENSKAIGRAASFGDLSENAEWTAAIEEQRLLTDKAKQMEEELAIVQTLEDQKIADEMVAPGVTVAFREIETGEERTYTILGPWDVGEDGVISYLAPVAAGLLGKKAGEQATLSLPSGEIVVEILTTEKTQRVLP